MKKLFSLIMTLLLATTFTMLAEEGAEEQKKWVLDGVAGINASQTSLTNWSGGGENSLAGNAYLNGTLNYAKDKWAWDNALVLDYGLARTSSTGVRKSTDKIDFASKLGYKAVEKLFYTAAFDFKTQFTDGYKYDGNDRHRISNFMAPAYGTLSLGIDYKPTDKFSLYLSPIAGKMTWVHDKEFSDKGMFGVDKGDRFKGEFGAYLKTIYKVTPFQNVDMVSKADFFTAYDNSFANVDIDWDLMINMKVNKYLSATFNTTLRYDDDVHFIDENGTSKGPRVQFRQILGVGLAYKF